MAQPLKHRQSDSGQTSNLRPLRLGEEKRKKEEEERKKKPQDENIMVGLCPIP